jgi:uncharacterized coiled-coil protein SlyX
MAHNISEAVIKAMESKIAEQEQAIASLTSQLKAKEVELSEQVKAKNEELRQMKRELDATEVGRVRLQRELNDVRPAAVLLNSTSSV